VSTLLLINTQSLLAQTNLSTCHVGCDVDTDQELVTADVKKRISVLGNELPPKFCLRNIGLVLLQPRVLQFGTVSHSVVNPHCDPFRLTLLFKLVLSNTLLDK
jgi:hypothetical protein